ncbi:hypothetical protein LTS08_005680 [Lithohypha guttulata]|nr:hypothetical protein LTS08_005680 [Lithohypha guttulata]
MSSTPSKETRPQRRNTGMRATIKRIFSNKTDKHTLSQKGAGIENDLGRILSMTGPQPDVLSQSATTNRNKVSPNTALHSHACSPHLRVESADVGRFEPTISQLGPRRNTVPSLMLVTVDEPTQSSCNAQETRTSPRTPSTAIKRQTSPLVHANRRSRSADDLANVLQKQSNNARLRDRAEEIAFWRNSIVIEPLPSLPLPAQTTPQQVAEVPETQKVPTATRPSFEPIQHFDFGLEQSNTLLERVNTLEVKLHDFEFALCKLQGTDINQPDEPKQISPPRLMTQSFMHSVDTSNQSYSPCPSEQWQRRSPKQGHKIDRASKATTIKIEHQRRLSNRSETSTPSSIRLTQDQYDTLCAMVQDEKIARQTLEDQVMNLQKEVDMLRSPVYAYVNYPTPSPDDSFQDTNYVSTPRVLRRSPPLQPRRNLNETSRFSMTETDTDTEVGDHYPEVYETPQANNFAFQSSRSPQSDMI